MNTHNICFYAEIGKNYPRIITKYSSLTIPLKYVPYFSTKICIVDSLEAASKGASYEYPQHIFSWRNKKKISIGFCRKKST